MCLHRHDIFTGCGDDDNAPGAITLLSLNATGTSLTDGSSITADLNAATSAIDVPINATITAEFSRDIDQATVNATSIKLSTADSELTFMVVVDGSSVIITPDEALIRGTIHTIAISADVKATELPSKRSASAFQ